VSIELGKQVDRVGCIKGGFYPYISPGRPPSYRIIDPPPKNIYPKPYERPTATLASAATSKRSLRTLHPSPTNKIKDVIS